MKRLTVTELKINVAILVLLDYVLQYITNENISIKFPLSQSLFY